MYNRVHNLCRYPHYRGARSSEWDIHREIRQFSASFPYFYMVKRYKLINFARYTQMVYNYIYCCYSAD